jgi:thiol:disulfide interchange protein DsbD
LQHRSASVLRVLFALLFAVIGWTFAQELTQTSDTSTAVHAPNAPTTATAHGWQAWSESKVAQELAQNRPVFVDFTAAWCVTCQINKKTTLTNAEIVADFATHQITLLRADWTRRDPAITAALTALGRSGVPVYVLYAPGRAPQVLSELLSVRQVRDALATLPATTSSPSASEFRLQPKPNVPSPLSLPKS